MKMLLSMVLLVFAIPVSSANNSYPLEVVKQPDQRWRFQHLMAYADDDSTQISGRLTASNNQFNLPRGHVDIAVYTSSGKLITETVSGYVPAILTHTMRKKGGVYFSTTFKQLLPPDAIVKFAFHKTQPTVAIKPSHQGNIAQ